MKKWMVAFKDDKQYALWKKKRPNLWHRCLKDIKTGIIYVAI
jgi:hypothetical protein